MFNIFNKYFNRKLKGLSLIEVSIALVIIGLLLLGAMQGWKWVESAKMSNTTQQILQIQTAFSSYKQSYYKKPSKEDFWKTLAIFGGPKPIKGESKITSSIGAIFEYDQDAENIILAPLSPLQANHIKNTLDPDNNISQGWIVIKDHENGRCIKDNKLDLDDKAKICAVHILLT